MERERHDDDDDWWALPCDGLAWLLDGCQASLGLYQINYNSHLHFNLSSERAFARSLRLSYSPSSHLLHTISSLPASQNILYVPKLIRTTISLCNVVPSRVDAVLFILV
jgi:hypothetical protein